MHVCTYTHPYIHIYFTACGPPKNQRVMKTSTGSFILTDKKTTIKS